MIDLKNDAYDFEAIGKILKDKIISFTNMDDCENRSLGIYGEWGTGKSSLIDYISDDLSKNNSIEIIRVELWKYELFSDDLSMISKEIFQKILSFGQNKDKATEILKKITKDSFAILKLFSPLLGTPGQILENVNGKINPQKDHNNFLEDIKKILVKKKILIIFDELDRCSTSKIDTYLNFIKHIVANFSQNIYTAIVFDYDYTLSMLFPKEIDKYKQDLFFEKIIIDSFNIEDFLIPKKISNKLDNWIDDDIFDALVKTIKLLPRTRLTLFNKVNNIHNELISINQKYNRNVSSWKNIILYLLYIKLILEDSESILNIYSTINKAIKKGEEKIDNLDNFDGEVYEKRIEMFKKIISNPEVIPQNFAETIQSNISKAMSKEIKSLEPRTYLAMPQIESKEQFKYIDSCPILIKDHENNFEKYKLFLCSYAYNANSSQNVLSNIDSFVDWTKVQSLCNKKYGRRDFNSWGNAWINDGSQTFSYPNLWNNEILKNDLNIFLVEPIETVFSLILKEAKIEDSLNKSFTQYFAKVKTDDLFNGTTPEENTKLMKEFLQKISNIL